MRNKLPLLSLALAIGFAVFMPLSGGQSLFGAGVALADSEHESHGDAMSGQDGRSSGEVADAEVEGGGESGAESDGAGKLGVGPVFKEVLPCTDPNGCDKTQP